MDIGLPLRELTIEVVDLPGAGDDGDCMVEEEPEGGHA